MTDCIIIGSGLAGLTAARVLSSAGLKVVLVEGRNRMGGRTITNNDLGAPVDLGGAQIHGWREGNPVRKVAEGFGLTAHVPEGAKILVIGADGPLDASAAGALLSKSTPFSAPFPPPQSSTSLAALHLPTRSSPELLALARTAEIGAGVKLESISAKYWGFGKGFAGTDGAPVGGYSKIIAGLWEECKKNGATLELEEDVVAVSDMGEEVKVRSMSGNEWVAKTVVSTIPLAVLQHRSPTFSPPLPLDLRAAISRTSAGALEKVVLNYESAWWPSPASYGTFMLLPTTQHTSVTPLAAPTSLKALFQQTTLPVTNYVRVSHQPHNSLLVYLGADAASFIATYPAEEVAQELHSYLASRLSPNTAPPKPTKYLVTDWLKDPFSLGATSSPIGLGKSEDGEQTTPLDFVIMSRPQWGGRLGFAGEATDLDHRGSVVGAVVSGEREGKRVAELLERKKAK